MMSDMYELNDPSKAVAWARICAVMSDGIWIVPDAACANAKTGASARIPSIEMAMIFFFMRIREGVPSLHPLAYTF